MKDRIYTMNNKKIIFEIICLVISIIFIVLGYILTQSDPQAIYIPIMFGLSFVIGGYAKAKEGIVKTIKNKTLNVEILMILAALGAFVIGDYFEGAILIFIFSISGILELYATSKSQKALTSLLKLAPKTALKMIDGIEKEVEVSTLVIGDQVIVKVGQQIPVDGIIVKGVTTLNQSAITGEFKDVEKKVDDEVLAGSINIESTIIVQTTKDPKQSTVQKIVSFVEQAQANKPKTQSIIEKIEKYYAYVVVIIAILFMTVPPLFGWWTSAYAFNRGIIVLVVGSPCALVASISPAMLSALSNGARHNILIKGGPALEKFTGLKGVAMDKTGTITTGMPKVHSLEILKSIDKENAYSIIKTIESDSNHPLAKALVEYLSDIKIIPNVQTIEKSGRGMEARIGDDYWKIGRYDGYKEKNINHKYQQAVLNGHSVVSIIKNDKMIGFIALIDTIKENVKLVMENFKAMGIKTILLTGDNETAAKAIAEQAGIETYKADCLPEDKVNIIKKLKGDLGKIMMVGDGINDAPALAIADASIAMGKGTDISLETSDVIITNDKLENIVKVVKLSKRMQKITFQNIIFSVIIIVILMLANVFGVIQLPTGVIAHEMSTILVILNSLRLLI